MILRDTILQPLVKGKRGYHSPRKMNSRHECCAAREPRLFYCCTRQKGHKGPHAAHNPQGEQYLSWNDNG